VLPGCTPRRALHVDDWGLAGDGDGLFERSNAHVGIDRCDERAGELDAFALDGGEARPVEQGEGDSVVGAFSMPSDALAAALDAQRAFAQEPWPPGGEVRVRMAIHTGETRLRDAGNYFGPTIIRCARVGK